MPLKPSKWFIVACGATGRHIGEVEGTPVPQRNKKLAKLIAEQKRLGRTVEIMSESELAHWLAVRKGG